MAVKTRKKLWNIKCPCCGNADLDELGESLSTGEVTYGCPKCKTRFTIHDEEYDLEK